MEGLEVCEKCSLTITPYSVFQNFQENRVMCMLRRVDILLLYVIVIIHVCYYFVKKRLKMATSVAGRTIPITDY